MAKRLYCVRVEWCFYAMAENEAEARGRYRDAQGDMGSDAVAYADEVDDAERVEGDWLESIPYGSTDDRTVGELLGTSKEEQAQAFRDRLAWDLHPKLPLLEVAA